ncbi:hypothetical protein BH11VER1_BH11VER1_01100 [soil metagenome]
MKTKQIIRFLSLFAALPAVASANEGHVHATSSGLLEQNAPHLHLLTNHLPIFGIVMGLLALALAFLWKNEVSKRIALILLLLSHTGAFLTYNLGQYAYRPVRRIADEDGQIWLDTHMDRAESGIYVFYLATFIILAALYAAWRKPRWAAPLTIAAGIVSAATLGTAGWIADAGGKVRHSELRGNHTDSMQKNESPISH